MSMDVIAGMFNMDEETIEDLKSSYEIDESFQYYMKHDSADGLLVIFTRYYQGQGETATINIDVGTLVMSDRNVVTYEDKL